MRTISLLSLLFLFSLTTVACSSPTFTYNAGEKTEEKSSDKSSEKVESTDDEKVDIDLSAIATTVAEGTDVDLSKYNTHVLIEKGGDYTITGVGSSVIVNTNSEDVTLTFKDAIITGATIPAIYVASAGTVNMNFEGNNEFNTEAEQEYDDLDGCIYAEVDLDLGGDGYVSIDSAYEHGIKTTEELTIDSGNYTISAENDGIHSKGNMTINGGTFNIDVKGEGIESKDELTINNGEITVNAVDDGINAANVLTVNDGTLVVTSSTNDALDSNGSIVFNGGSISGYGLKSPEEAFDIDNNTFEINGGEIFGLGSMAESPTSTKQPVILIGSTTSVKSVEVKEGTETILSKTIEIDNSNPNITISSAKLKSGSTYTVYINGEELEEVTLEDDVTKIGNVESMNGAGGGMQGMQKGDFGGGGKMNEDFDPTQQPEDLPDDANFNKGDMQDPPEMPSGDMGNFDPKSSEEKKQ